MTQSLKVTIATVLYKPDRDCIHRLTSWLRDDMDLIIVDNNTDREIAKELTLFAENQRVHLIKNEKNVGIGEGLNQSIRLAESLGTEWILTLDQDSEPRDGMFEKLVEVLAELGPPDDLAILAPQIIESGSRKKMRYLRRRKGPFFKREGCVSGEILQDISMVLSSGSLIRMRSLNQDDLFRGDFFIDYVDTEYCLRKLSQGFRIAVVCGAHLFHRLGDRKVEKFGPLTFHPTFHNPTRWYYISRNRIPMLRMYALKYPHWLSFEILSSIYIIIRMLIFEDSRWLKLKALFLGTLDGIWGRMGSIPLETEARLSQE